MYMIGHYQGDLEIHAPVVLMQTSIQHNRTDLLGKNPAVVSAECEEVRFGVPLQVWKLAAVPT